MRQRHLTAELSELNAQLPQLYQQVSVRAVITPEQSIYYTDYLSRTHSVR